VGTPMSGVVVKLFVSVGQQVKAADTLFVLDDRRERAALALRETLLAEAKAKLERLLQLPRKEELPAAAQESRNRKPISKISGCSSEMRRESR